LGYSDERKKLLKAGVAVQLTLRECCW